MDKNNLIYMYMDNGKLNIDKIADEYSGYLWKIITNSGIYKEDEIKDIISDAYLVLWNKQNSLDINNPLSPYLVGIVKNLIRRYFSRLSNKIIESNIEDYENMIIEDNVIETNFENKEINSNILRILKSLKREEKNIFMDFYYEERKIREIAIKYNFSEGKVKTKLHRIRNKIRKELLKGGYSVNE